jgi:hypothetical protein
MLGCSGAGAVDRGSGYSQGALREQEVLIFEAMRTEEEEGGRRRELGRKGWLAGGQETCASAALLGEDKRRWLGFRGEGMCLSVRLSLLAGCWLSAFGSWELGVGCWVLAGAALCWLSGCLAVWLAAREQRERGRERGRG